MTSALPPAHLGGSDLGSVRHVCAFFNGEEAAARILVPFLLDGLASGEKALLVVRSGEEPRHVERLAKAGVDLDSLRPGQLELRSNTETYLRDGKFDQDRMLGAFEDMATKGVSAGFRRSRIVCDMDWIATAPSAHNDVIEFESRVNDVWQRHNDVVVCVYDLKKVTGDMAIDIMRTHPLVLIGSTLQQNPFYVPPAQFLRERRGVEAD